MSEKVLSEDHRKTLMDLFFAVILTDGLAKLVSQFILNDSQHIVKDYINQNQIITSLNPIIFATDFPNSLFKNPHDTWSLLFFAGTFFWILSHWVFYHELIRRHPYYRWRKFFTDITIFSLMFIILHLSLSVYDPRIFSLFVLLIAIWHATAALWHFADRGLRPIRDETMRHLVKAGVFLVLFSIAYMFSVGTFHDVLFRNTLMALVILLMVGFNVERLSRFISKKEIVSHCCIFYSNSKQEIIEEPSLMAYPPQMYTIELLRTYIMKMLEHGKENNITIKDRAAEIIEVLIYYWLSSITNFYDANYCFTIKRNSLNSMIEKLSLKDNVFLNVLYSDCDDRQKDVGGIMTINLPEDIEVKRIKSCRHSNGHTPSTSGTITIERKHFSLTIKYEESSKYRKDLLSPILPYRVSKSLDSSIQGISINPIYMGDKVFKILSNIGQEVYRIEFHAAAKLSTRIRSIYSSSAAREIEWLDLMADCFNDFFDIDIHVDRVKKAR
jgi:hypothetical protein